MGIRGEFKDGFPAVVDLELGRWWHSARGKLIFHPQCMGGVTGRLLGGQGVRICAVRGAKSVF